MRDQLAAALRGRNVGWKNCQRFVEWCRQFILFHGKRHPRELEAGHIEQLLQHLAMEQSLAAA